MTRRTSPDARSHHRSDAAPFLPSPSWPTAVLTALLLWTGASVALAESGSEPPAGSTGDGARGAAQEETAESEAGSAPGESGVQGKAAPADERPTNTLRWATASEVDNFGYDVYRAESPDGPFERMTEEPIAGAGTTDEVSEYFFIDDDIDPTRAYYYYVESIDLSGHRERFTPVQRAAPKVDSESGDGDSGEDGEEENESDGTGDSGDRSDRRRDGAGTR
ncbi:MAG: hypothetical protein MI919_13975 [Holophagales bacterium]|nr:hypothetical protein [Holophagales bacterium]